MSGKVGPVKPVNHTSWVTVITPTDLPLLSWVFASTLLWWSIFGPGLNDPGMLFCAVCICLFVVNFNLHYKFWSHSEIEFPYFLCMLCWWYHLGYTNIDYLVNLTETSWWNSFLDFFGVEFHQKSIKCFWRNIKKLKKIEKSLKCEKFTPDGWRWSDNGQHAWQ